MQKLKFLKRRRFTSPLLRVTARLKASIEIACAFQWTWHEISIVSKHNRGVISLCCQCHSSPTEKQLQIVIPILLLHVYVCACAWMPGPVWGSKDNVSPSTFGSSVLTQVVRFVCLALLPTEPSCWPNSVLPQDPGILLHDKMPSYISQSPICEPFYSFHFFWS